MQDYYYCDYGLVSGDEFTNPYWPVTHDDLPYDDEDESYNDSFDNQYDMYYP